MSSLTERTISLTPEQTNWTSQVIGHMRDNPEIWKRIGDCNNGSAIAKDDKLGIKLEYSYVTKLMHITVQG